MGRWSKVKFSNVVVLGIANDDYFLGKIVFYFMKLSYFFSAQHFSIRSFSFHYNSYDCVETDDLKFVKVTGYMITTH